MSSEVAIFLSIVLVATALFALFSRSVSVSLIMLFYSSLVLGIIFSVYGSVIIGLFEIITFAGAVSVMLLTAVLMTGESKLNIGANKINVALVMASTAAVVVSTFTIFLRLPVTETGLPFSSLLQFVWEFRPWDLLILLIVFTSAMVVVVNLFSKESQ